jgi:hypothetical protein
MRTNSSGHSTYSGLPAGIYRVVLKIDNIERDAVDNVQTKPGEPAVIDFDLSKTRRNN